MRKIVFILFLMLFVTLRTEGQFQNTYGNLLRIDFIRDTFTPGDTLGSWYNSQGTGPYGPYSHYYKYFEHFSSGGKSYFLSRDYSSFYSSPGSEYSNANRYIECEEPNYMRRFGSGINAGWDIMTPFMIDRTIVINTMKGTWLISGDFGNAYVTSSDSLLLLGRASGPVYPSAANIRAALGKVGDRYLASFAKNYTDYEYFLVNLNDSLLNDTLKAEKVIFNNISGNTYQNQVITEIRNIANDIYAVSCWRKKGIDIYWLKGNTFSYLKTVLEDEFVLSSVFSEQWEYRNGRLYNNLGQRQLQYWSYNSQDTTFENRTVLMKDLQSSAYNIPGNYAIDNNYRYLAKIFRNTERADQDTLRIYDIDKEKFISSICLNGIKGAYSPIIDSPFVYIHQITRKVSDVESGKNSLSITDYSLEAYPNPFNPASTIRYTLPAGTHVKLQVYDVLGNEITSLCNEYKSAGVHTVQFSAGSLPSGVYIYRIHAGQFREAKKLLLIK